jgi:uncharacterized membrane-anchored protein
MLEPPIASGPLLYLRILAQTVVGLVILAVTFGLIGLLKFPVLALSFVAPQSPARSISCGSRSSSGW